MTEAGAVRPDRTAEGVALILASVVTMAFADAVVKLVSADMTVWQVFLIRSVFALLCLAGLIGVRGGRMRLRVSRWVTIRSLLLILTWLAYYASLPVLDLSVAAVAVYTNPILTALFTAAFLAERVTARQWVGVFLGFLGVVAILRPGGEAFSWMVLLPLLAAALYSLAMVLTRSRCQEEDAMDLAVSLHGAFILTGLAGSVALSLVGLGDDVSNAYPFLLGGWASMGPREWGLMALIGLLSAAYMLGVARAYQIARPQIIATFDYGYLASAALWGVVFFAETPDRFTLIGMALIMLAGLLVAARSTPKTKTKRVEAAAD